MDRYHLTVRLDSRATPTQRSRAMSKIKGPLSGEWRDMLRKGQKISCVPWVSQVTMTRVREDHEGIWEKGSWRGG